jgi:GNAT superfamily N-acetyltransferase
MAMTITYQLDSAEEFIRDAQGLWAEHHELLGTNKDKMPLKPDMATYAALWNTGALQILTCRDDGKLIGYVVTVIRPHMHYAETLCGFEDMYFLTEAYRGGMIGPNLLRQAEKHLKAAGVKKLFFHTKSFFNRGKLFEKLGFSLSDLIYSKWIGD